MNLFSTQHFAWHEEYRSDQNRHNPVPMKLTVKSHTRKPAPKYCNIKADGAVVKFSQGEHSGPWWCQMGKHRRWAEWLHCSQERGSLKRVAALLQSEFGRNGSEGRNALMRWYAKGCGGGQSLTTTSCQEPWH